MNNLFDSKTTLRKAMLVTALAAGLGLGVAHAATDDSTPTGAEKAVKKTERVASDSWITTKVKSEILASSLTKGVHVSVKTLHGDVRLKGKLATQDAIDQVKAIAEKVKGVKSVDTSMLVVATAQ